MPPDSRLRRLWTGALDVLYPPKCGLCGLFDPNAICAICAGELREWEDDGSAPPEPLAYRGAVYAYESRAAQAVTRLKFGRITSLADPMARLLAQFVERESPFHFDRVVPVPIHWSRRCHRGFNQAELLCEAMEQAVVDRRLLVRVRATRPQVGLSPQERAGNLTGAFRVRGTANGLSILLVDDVSTSGSTAVECARTLLAAGARQVGIATFAAG